MTLWEIVDGRYPICAIGTKTECQVIEYIDQLEKSNPPEYRKVLSRLDIVAENGPPRNIEQNRPLDNKCYELKISQTRIGYFWERGSMIVCLMAFPKKSQKTPQHILKKIYDIKRRYDNENN